MELHSRISKWRNNLKSAQQNMNQITHFLFWMFCTQEKKGFTRYLQGLADVADPLKGSAGEDEIYDGFVLVKVL